MFHSLYSKLALALFVILCLFGLAFSQMLRISSEQYQMEVSQRLNENLAEHLKTEIEFFKDDETDQAGLKEILHMLMVINHSIEVYLLDTKGKILKHAAPQGKVKRSSVSIEPILKFMDKQSPFPITGDDPRDLTRQKAFSVTEIRRNDILQGYLYIILDGEQYDGIAQMLKDSYIMRLSLWGVAIALVIAFVIGLLVFSLMTRRLRRLTDKMNMVTGNNQFEMIEINEENNSDEVSQLTLQFNNLIRKINSQFSELKNVDQMRRDLIANVSHDLRTPITTLQGYLETLLLKDESLSDNEKSKYLKISIKHSKQLSRLVTELFELAKLDSCDSILYAEPFSLAELIQDVMQKFELISKKMGIKLKYQYQNEPGLVYGDIGMMQRAMENLIENALRHTQQGGNITVAIKTTDDKVIVIVADTGCGIPKAELSQIFNRFYRVDKSRSNTKGSGLGLAITKRILELHGSDINVKSQLNKGTTFTFQIPTYRKLANH